ncbi:MAG: hypothetical protein AB7K52_02765 [Phycisphaerales bacterium]
MIPRSVLLVAVAAAALLGGCAVKNIDVVNESGLPVRIAQVESPRIARQSGDETVLREVRLAPGERVWLTVKPAAAEGMVPRLRAAPAVDGAGTQWIDLPVGGSYILTIGPEAPGLPIALRLEALPPPKQTDASERQRRDIVDRPPAHFDSRTR